MLFKLQLTEKLGTRFLGGNMVIINIIFYKDNSPKYYFKVFKIK